jgi:hypothetical protein
MGPLTRLMIEMLRAGASAEEMQEALDRELGRKLRERWGPIPRHRPPVVSPYRRETSMSSNAGT